MPKDKSDAPGRKFRAADAGCRMFGLDGNMDFIIRAECRVRGAAAVDFGKSAEPSPAHPIPHDHDRGIGHRAADARQPMRPGTRYDEPA